MAVAVEAHQQKGRHNKGEGKRRLAEKLSQLHPGINLRGVVDAVRKTVLPNAKRGGRLKPKGVKASETTYERAAITRGGQWRWHHQVGTIYAEPHRVL